MLGRPQLTTTLLESDEDVAEEKAEKGNADSSDAENGKFRESVRKVLT